MTTIGKQKRKFVSNLKLGLPGVGTYHLNEAQFRKTKGGRFNRAIRSITQVNQTNDEATSQKNSFRKPGPGSYSLQLKSRQKIISFPQSKRFGTDHSLYLPGPGSYKSEQCSKQRIKAGVVCRSERSSSKQKQKSPGPSDYEMPLVTIYKKKDPFPFFNKAKRAFHSTKYEESVKRYNQSREQSERGQTERNKDIIQRGTTYDRAWHGKKIEKQAKRLQKDQFVVNP